VEKLAGSTKIESRGQFSMLCHHRWNELCCRSVALLSSNQRLVRILKQYKYNWQFWRK